MPPEFERYYVGAQRALMALMSAEPEPAPSGNPTSASPSPSAPDLTKNARNAKENAELLHEVYRVVFDREPRDRAEFGNLVDSMNQGASVEGMYNGFTHSVDYRKLETTGPVASPAALKHFGDELALLELELPKPTEFDASEIPNAHPQDAGDGTISYGKVPQPGVNATPTPSGSPDASTLSARYTQQFVGTSIFTLKRVLGDEALRVAAFKKAYPEKLALWYSQWVTHMSTLGVDYGIALRNRADEPFHYKWALTAGEDRIRWEILNRLHRVLNEANRPK